MGGSRCVEEQDSHRTSRCLCKDPATGFALPLTSPLTAQLTPKQAARWRDNASRGSRTQGWRFAILDTSPPVGFLLPTSKSHCLCSGARGFCEIDAILFSSGVKTSLGEPDRNADLQLPTWPTVRLLRDWDRQELESGEVSLCYWRPVPLRERTQDLV